MSGQNNGFTAVLKKESPGHIHTWCYAHVIQYIHTSFEEISTTGQTQTGLGSRVYPFTAPGCCTAWIRCWQ